MFSALIALKRPIRLCCNRPPVSPFLPPLSADLVLTVIWATPEKTVQWELNAERYPMTKIVTSREGSAIPPLIYWRTHRLQRYSASALSVACGAGWAAPASGRRANPRELDCCYAWTTFLLASGIISAPFLRGPGASGRITHVFGRQ